MTMRFAITTVVVMALVCQSSSARATMTYDFITYSDTYAGCTLSGSITTDGHTGDITSSDLLSWQITITGPDLPTLVRDQTTSIVNPDYCTLTATGQDLTVSVGGYLEFDDSATDNALLIWSRADNWTSAQTPDNDVTYWFDCATGFLGSSQVFRFRNPPRSSFSASAPSACSPTRGGGVGRYRASKAIHQRLGKGHPLRMALPFPAAIFDHLRHRGAREAPAHGPGIQVWQGSRRGRIKSSIFTEVWKYGQILGKLPVGWPAWFISWRGSRYRRSTLGETGPIFPLYASTQLDRTRRTADTPFHPPCRPPG